MYTSYLHKDSPRTIFGMSVETGMGRGDILMLDALIASMDADAGPGLIVELGTSTGFTSLFLSLCAQLRGVPFFSYDNNIGQLHPAVKKAWRHGTLHIEDVLEEGGIAQLNALLRTRRVFILLDNGNKAQEFAVYVPCVRVPCSVIAVHDWMTEFHPVHVQPSHGQHLEKLLWELSDNLHSSIRAWKMMRV